MLLFLEGYEMESSQNLSDFRKMAEFRVKGLLDKSKQSWRIGIGTNKLLVIDCEDGYRYIVTSRLDYFILRYKQRGKNWKWISSENMVGHVTSAENSSPSARKSSLNLRSIFKRLRTEEGDINEEKD